MTNPLIPYFKIMKLYQKSPTNNLQGFMFKKKIKEYYIIPWLIIAFATLIKPAMLAPLT